jgi:hypothetical protein
MPASRDGRDEAAHGTEGTVSEFDKFKDDAEQYAQQHPQQVHEGEQDAEKKFGLGGGQQDQGGYGQDQGGQDQGGQDQSGQYGQDQGGQDPGNTDQQQQGY